MKKLPVLRRKFNTIETPDNPRALPAKELAKAAKKYNPDAESTAGIQDAVNKAFALAEEDENYVILAFGSLSFIGALTDAVKKRETKNN